MTSGRDLFAPKLGLTLPLCGLHFVFFLLAAMNPKRVVELFGFWPHQALAQPWGFVTFQFLHSGPMSLFFGAFALYILGSALEGEWGTGEYTAFWGVATLGASLSAWTLGTPLLSDPFVVPISMLFAYAFLFPETQFLVFFVIPVKVKWLAWLSAAFLAFAFFGDLVTYGAGPALVRVLGAGAGFLFFWVRHHGRFKARKAAREAVVAVKTAAVVRQDEALEKRNRELFPRVEALRASEKAGVAPPGGEGLRNELGRLVVPGVNICKPVDFKGDRDITCLRCEGFAECSLRYLSGQPEEIVVKKRDG
ncbi:MAG: rhomboid family intramembrane serine protease [Thermoanaerobaculia bacterium]